ncbi:unnamed protein product [Pelagomonas calceolata]|uniref:Phytanoyl-CoA dioxygenase n=1 Tax=Pelagomonas calceolata TaxID=35677 RepID=A0A8J2WJ51_9STRA|nr:unnamed protein product [Pelagomonas calceolata]|mmetsp:Transcript_18526/g.55391  ORF Transcript_18526/g.55391 Transcript_18526/m.55391 type:complete len:394 (-) Transcript_18526:9-1190(-)
MILLLLTVVPVAAFTPWARNDSAAYVFRDHVTGVLEKRRRKLDALRRKGGDAIIRDAVGRGLHWNALGVAFPRDARDDAFEKFAQTVVAHQPVDRAMLRHDTLAGRRLTAADHDAMRSERRRLATVDADQIGATGDDARNSRRRLAAHDAGRLDATGAAIIDDWGLSFENVTRISLKAHAALGREARKQNLTAGVVEATLLPGDVAAWLASPRLRAALDAYLGAKAYVRTRIGALRLTNRLTAPYSGAEPNLLGYPSGFWHHDRCGRRVKAFLFLHDVKADGRPTLIAEASHRTHYYEYKDLLQSRFSDEYISSNYDVVQLVGPRGGGFLFDTNTIHKGRSDGKRGRTVIIADFMDTRKLYTFKKLRYRGPCGQHRTVKMGGEDIACQSWCRR